MASPWLPQADPIRLAVEIERAAETISGSIAVETGPAREFFGWLELMGLLHEAANRLDEPLSERDRDRDRPSPPCNPTTQSGGGLA